MLTDQEIRECLKDVNFGWADSEVFTASGDEFRNIDTFTITFSLLIEILAEVKKINKGGD